MTNIKALEQNTRMYDDVWNYVKENIYPKDIEKYINSCSRRQLLDMYLKWNGIIGYTDAIVSMVSLMFPGINDNEICEVDFDTKVDGTF